MQGDKTDIARWIDSRFAKGQLPPFSFILDEKPSEEFLRSWRWSRTAPASTDKDVVLRTFTYTDPRSGLEVVCDVKGYPSSGPWRVRISSIRRQRIPGNLHA